MPAMPLSRLNQIDGLALTSVERYETFAEQGIAVLLTTPELGSARLRRVGAADTELLVPGLGGRGVYVLEWATALHRVQPTLHDHQLWPHLAAIRRITPAAVRQASRSVAALGSAGRGAANSAIAALEALSRAREEAERQIGQAIAPKGKQANAEARVGWLANILAEIGAGETDGELLRARLVDMERLAVEAHALSERLPAGAERTAATIIVAGARITLSAIPSCIQPLRAALAQLPAMFAAGESALALIETLVERVEFLLDGWTSLIALWDAVPIAERASILSDLLAALPVPAREANAWSRHLAAWDDLAAARRRIPLRRSWRQSGRVIGIALNEAVLARVA